MNRHELLLALISAGGKHWLDPQHTIYEVEYIEGHGNEYIQTGEDIPADNLDYNFNIDFELTDLATKQNICGCENSFLRFMVCSLSDGFITINSVKSTYQPSINEKININSSGKTGVNNIAYINSEQITINIRLVTRLFCIFTTNLFTNKAKMKLYGLQLTIGENSYNFTPAYNTTTQQYGLYDTINNVWYGNNGTGAFTGA